jgi:hypothetical protein
MEVWKRSKLLCGISRKRMSGSTLPVESEEKKR